MKPTIGRSAVTAAGLALALTACSTGATSSGGAAASSSSGAAPSSSAAPAGSSVIDKQLTSTSGPNTTAALTVKFLGLCSGSVGLGLDGVVASGTSPGRRGPRVAGAR